MHSLPCRSRETNSPDVNGNLVLKETYDCKNRQGSFLLFVNKGRLLPCSVIKKPSENTSTTTQLLGAKQMLIGKPDNHDQFEREGLGISNAYEKMDVYWGQAFLKI